MTETKNVFGPGRDHVFKYARTIGFYRISHFPNIVYEAGSEALRVSLMPRSDQPLHQQKVEKIEPEPIMHSS